jgi:tripartite-type tricarboxylate transporter receptor subunit TctC
MNKRSLMRLTFSAAAAMAAMLPLGALAQADYPTKPIKLISPFPAGGTSDVMARMLAEELTKQLKQPVLVENIGGAGGVVGTDRAVKSAGRWLHPHPDRCGPERGGPRHQPQGAL